MSVGCFRNDNFREGFSSQVLSKSQHNTISTVVGFDTKMALQTPPTHPTRGAKSMAIWQPSCQKVFKESYSGRKFWDPTLTLSCNQAIWWKRTRNCITKFSKYSNFLSIFYNIPKKQQKLKLMLYQCTFILKNMGFCGHH